MQEEDRVKIEIFIKGFLEKLAVPALALEVSVLPAPNHPGKELVYARVDVQEPQMLIGHNGQTLWELERLFKIILHKKLGKDVHINLDVNHYKEKKDRHLKDMARSWAQEVLDGNKEKALPPMSSYDRRIIHAELAGMPGLATESRGEGSNRHLVIKPG